MYAYCYGSMLVARKLGWDLLDSCCNNPEDTQWNDVEDDFPSFNKKSNRNLLIFEKHRFLSHNVQRFFTMPGLKSMFPHVKDEVSTLPGPQTGLKNQDVITSCTGDARSLLSVVNPDQWKEELHLCYKTGPKRMFPYWYVPGTLDQMNVKKAAGMVAYEYLVEFLNKRNKDDIGQVLKEFQVKHFFDCLRSFHAIPVQLKCNAFDLKYKAYVSVSCPLGTGYSKRRSHHKLNFIGKGNI